MKQQNSILKWASLTLEEQVKSLSAIQDVKFIKNLLWKIDSEYFAQWEIERGTQSFAQVVSQIGKYFKQQIGTDIKPFIQTLNVFKNPMDLWQLLLGIAIKGSNRGNNINLILDMDHTVQSELVGIVSSIIDKFGQEAANNKDGPLEDKQADQHVNEHQLMMDLMKQQEELTNQIIQLQTDLYKEQQQIKTVLSQKKELQQQIFMYKLQKASFLQTLANGNRSDSRIFDDGEETVLQTGNLTELANDIIVFVRDLRKRVIQETEKNSALEEELRQIKYQAAQTAEQNESYLLQLGNLNIYQNQIDKLRQEINQVFNENALLIDRINELEEDKSKLILNLRKKRKQSEQGDLEAQLNPVKTEQALAKRKRVHFQKKQQNGSNKSSDYQAEGKGSEGAESEGQKNTAKDELRQPKLRTKLQRQIEFLKISNETLKKQNSSLKLANQNLQQSARQFLISNQTIAKSWQEDFKVLIYQINQMGIVEEQQQQQNQEEQMQNREAQIQPQYEAEIVSKQNGETFQNEEVDYQRSLQEVERQKQIQKQKARQLQSKLQSITQEMNRQKKVRIQHQNEINLWRQIAGKLKALVARFRQNEINYQNTIYSLKLQNHKLVNSLEQSLIPAFSRANTKKQKLNIFIDEKVSNSGIQSDKQYQIKVHRISQQHQGQISPKSGPYMSFLSIRQGEELDEDTINKRNSQKSKFYNAQSKIVKQIQQNPIITEIQLQQKYINLNRRLFSQSKASLFNFKNEFTGNQVAKSAELQARFQNEIKMMEQQYAWLNGNYQQLFRKLNIYTDQLRVKQYAKLEGIKLLQEIENQELQVLQNKESQIIKLNELNKNLRAVLVQQASKKQQLLQIIRQIQNFGQNFFKNQENMYEMNLQKIIKSLQQIKHSFSQSLKNPMQFLQLRLQGENSGKAEQFYNLYSKQRQKNKQLTSQLQLLTATLLEYRNILQF